MKLDKSHGFMIPSVYEADSSSFKSSLSNWKSHLTSCSVLTASFYFFQMMAQRCYGRLGLHSGLSNTILTPVGCISTISTLLLSQNVETYIRNNPNQFGLQSFYTTRPPPSSLPSSSFPSFSFFSFGSTKAAVPVVRSPREERRYQLKRLVLGLSSFVALEQSAFRSVFPSSIISLGVFSNLSKRFRRSVATESALTTQSQRAAIQKLGKRFGCHHCGSRQFVFNRSKVFIADHMPPTKIAEALSRKWWRRLFGWTVQQRLWPQCYKCFQLQGMAVKNGVHLLVYHNVLKRFHFAPAAAYLLLLDDSVSTHLDRLLDPLVDTIEEITEKVQPALTSLLRRRPPS